MGSPAPQDGLALRVGAACPGMGSVGGVVGVQEHLGPSSNTTWSHKGGGTCFALSWSLALLNLAHCSADLGFSGR